MLPKFDPSNFMSLDPIFILFYPVSGGRKILSLRKNHPNMVMRVFFSGVLAARMALHV